MSSLYSNQAPGLVNIYLQYVKKNLSGTLKSLKGFFIMKAKNILPVVALSSLLSCTNKSNVKNVIPHYTSSPKFTELVKDTFSLHFSDENKIVEFNKLRKEYGQKVGNYIIVDKKNCCAKVYNSDGDVLYKAEVALGRNIGDQRGCGYKQKGVKLKTYTTPGEYTITKEGGKPGTSNDRLYGKEVLVLAGDHTKSISKGKQTLALHRVPKTEKGRIRECVFNNGTLKDNRVSFGCVNFLVDSFHKMRSLIRGRGTKVYILPEEKGNSLYLERQKNGEYKFFQKKYRYESQETD